LKKILFLIPLFFASFLFSQKTDSVKLLIEKENDNFKKVNLFVQLSKLYNGISKDTAIIFATNALDLARTTEDATTIINCLHNLGKITLSVAKYDKALASYKESVEYSEKLGNDSLIAFSKHKLGNVYLSQTLYDDALKQYLDALKIREKINDIEGIAATTNNIGTIYWNLGNQELAINYFKISLANEQKINNQKGIASSLNNIGLVFWKENINLDSALYYINKSIELKLIIGDEEGIAKSYVNLSVIYRSLKEYQIAIKYNKKAIVIFQKYENKSNISNAYNNIGNCFYFLKQYELSLNYLYKSLEIAKEINSFEFLRDCYGYLSQTDSAMGNFEIGFRHKFWASAYQDSVNKADYKSEVAEMETKYETQKIEKENDFQKLLINQQNAKAKIQNVIILLLILIVIGAIIFTIVLIKQIKQKKQANSELSQRNFEILQQQEEIKTQCDEIEMQRDSINEKHKIVSFQKKEIMDSIYYAERIQKAALPPDDFLNKIVPDHFIFFRPRNIVSGDFYWARQIENYITIAAADCTGHGVPGGFMSMLGISFLNEIITKKEVTKANQVLEELRIYVKNSLHQTGKIGETKDGMDIALCIIDTEKHILQFSGANNPMFYIKNSENEPIIEVFEATRNPIGIYIVEKAFINHEINYTEGDVFYLFTDGYIDQFGGENNKKFLISNLKKLLINNHKQDMTTQKQLIEITINNWQSNHKQIDDMLIIGVKM